MKTQSPIAVIGASGEIGARLVQNLLANGTPVRPISRKLGIRLARWKDLDFKSADWENLAALSSALSGCRSVINCAVIKDAQATDSDLIYRNQLGMVNLLKAMEANGISRLIHLSSIAVLPRRITPETLANPFAYSNEPDAYTRVKVESERMALAQRKKIEVTVIRPGVVYGPYMAWSQKALSATSASPFILPSSTALCPAVHVDDLVALCLYFENAKAPIPDLVHAVHPENPTWKSFFCSHAPLPNSVWISPPATLQSARPGLPRSLSAKAVLRWLWMSPLWHQALTESRVLSNWKRMIKGKPSSRPEFQPAFFESNAQTPNYLDWEVFQSTGKFGADLNGESLGFCYQIPLAKGALGALQWGGGIDH